MVSIDPSLIPLDELPLQTILHFQPCPLPVAASYLQCLCEAEGHPLSIDQLYETLSGLDSVDFADAPTNFTPASLPIPDLRHAIHHLQFWCPVKDKINLPKNVSEDPFIDLVDWDLQSRISQLQGDINPESKERAYAQLQPGLHHADLMSFADCYLTRRPSDSPDVSVPFLRHGWLLIAYGFARRCH